MQIIIFGQHRSGTSMTTRLINMMGAYFGPESSALAVKHENPKGFWERGEALSINEAILTSNNCMWDNLKNWPPEKMAAVPDNIKNEIKKFVGDMDEHQPWVLKDPRLCLTFPAWRPHLTAPIAVIVHRNPLEIAISLNKRNNLPIPYGIALWEHYATSLLNNTLGLPRAFVRYGDLHKRPVKTCEHLYDQLVAHGVRGLQMPPAEKIREFIDPALYRSKITGEEYKLSDRQKILIEMLRGERPQESKLIMRTQTHQEQA